MRLAEIVGALSIAADISTGCPMEKNLRTVVIACRLAKLLGARPDQLAQTFWIAVLRNIGCTAFAPEASTISVGDDISARRTMTYADPDRPVDAFRRMARGFAPDAGLLARASGIVKFALDRTMPSRFAKTHCESGMFFARSLGMADDVVRALGFAGERFDGKGEHGLRGDELPYGARVADVADVVELFWWLEGDELADGVLAQRSGRALDPEVVRVARSELGALTEGLRGGTAWDAYLAAEPEARVIEGEQIDRSCVALGRFADLTSLHTLSHSTRVANLVGAAADAAGLPAHDRVLARRAASLHDLGRVAVASGTWDKTDPLTAIEWQRVRSHSQQTEVVLRAGRLDALADIASATHERGRGVGYHKGVALDSVSFLAKLVAAADVMSALGEDRPHRPHRPLDRAAAEVRELVARGELDARAAQAVLDASGAAPGRKQAWPGGLSDREVEVLRLVAVGRTNKEIGKLLGMSARTAQRHVMNVYDKLGLESRAGLALYAVEHELFEH